jgi:hypothetical protein
MTQSSNNLRYLLWQQKVPQRTWAMEVAKWVGCDLQRAQALLSGERWESHELNALEDSQSIQSEEFQFSSLLDPEIIWPENVKHLLDQVKHGDLGKLAQHLGLQGQSTISKWKRKQSNPEKKYKQKLHDFFSLPNDIDLEQDAIFLMDQSIDVHARKAWLQLKIEQLNPKTLQQLFPALERLLRDP